MTTDSPMPWQQSFLEQHWARVCMAWTTAIDDAPAAPGALQLAAFRERLADRWQPDYGALAILVAQALTADSARLARPPLLAIAGPQGTGKSTLARHLAAWTALRGGRAAVLGLDDLYLPRAARLDLAARVHPLLRTRGVPGTHDIALGMRLLDVLATGGEDLLAAGGEDELLLPVFDKGLDDRLEVARWQHQRMPVDLVIIEGWCLGLPAQQPAALATAINSLESIDDADGRWRRWVDAQLRSTYARFFARFDRLLALLPPDFDAVLRWRTQQEQALPPARRMDAPALRRFVAHYERLTRHGLLAWPARADWCVDLAADHGIAGVHRGAAAG